MLNAHNVLAYSARNLCLFSQSAPECSRCILFQTTLSVGDVVFLSASESRSLLLCFCFIVSVQLKRALTFVLQYSTTYFELQEIFSRVLKISSLFGITRNAPFLVVTIEAAAFAKASISLSSVSVYALKPCSKT